MKAYALGFLLGLLPGCILGNCDPKMKKSELLPTEKRVLRSSIAIKALVSNLYPSQSEHGQTAELWILDVYKGDSKLAAALGIHQGPSGAFNLRDQRVNVSHEDSRCWNALIRQRSYIFLLSRNYGGHHHHKKSTPLTAKYDYGAAIDFNKDIENRILSSLGWEPWSEWEPCSRWCGGGQQKRQRVCSVQDGYCSTGYNVERRSCNYFTCEGSVDTLSVKEDRYYKPSPAAFQRTEDRGSWLIKPGSYFLLPYRQAFNQDFPKDFTIFLTLKPTEESEGIIFSLNARNSRQEYISLELNEGGHLELIHALSNGTKIIDIPAQVGDGKWHQISISIEGGSTVRTYLDCHWITTQILHKHALNVPPDTDLIIGYMFQGEMEQMTVHSKSNAVSEQCSPSQIPLRKEPEETKTTTGGPSVLGYTSSHEIPDASSSPSSGNNDFDIIEEDHPSPFRKIHRSDRTHRDQNDYLEEEYVDLDMVVSEPISRSVAKKYNNHPWTGVPSVKMVRSSSEEQEGSGREEESDDEDQWNEGEGSGSGEETFDLEWSSWSKCSGGSGCGTRGYRIRSARCLENDQTEECVLAGMERKQERRSCIVPCERRRGPAHRKKSKSQWIPVPKKAHQKFKGHLEGNQDSNTSKVVVCRNGGKLKTILLAMKCSCPRGYVGYQCEKPVCHPDGCANGGTCVEPDVCACPGGYTGARCEKAFCYPDCQNGGSCIAPFTCSCPSEVTGKYCEEFSCSPNCSNGGVCIGHNVCSCPHGYSGFNCQEQTCTLHCENGGICTMPGNKCKCAPGFYGTRCHKRVCQNYIALREPHRRILQKVVNVPYNATCTDGESCIKTRPEYRNFRKTIYRTVYRCADDINKKHKRKSSRRTST